MIRARSLLALALLGSAVVAGRARAQERARPDYELVRYDEDWSGPWAGEGDDLFDPLKRIVLFGADDLTLTLGADLRSRYELYVHPGFGLAGEEDDYLLLRALVHGDLRLTEHFRVFAQLGSFWMLGEATEPGPLDEDRLELQQVFAEAGGAWLGGHAWARVGRQEIGLGSQRLVSVRASPNLRRSFDAIRLGFRGDAIDLDVLGGLTVRPAIGVFDDAPNTGEALWGTYLVWRALGERFALDAYYLGIFRADREYPSVTGTEDRHSLGARAFGTVDFLDYNVEALLQLGRVADHDILAWTVASDTGATAALAADTSLRFGLRANVTSGDTSPDDRTIETFDALFPKLKYFSESGLLAPANFMDLHPAVALGWRDLELSLEWDFLWRTSTADTVYASSGDPIVPADSSRARFVGHELIVELGIEVQRHVALTFYYTHFFVGPFLGRAGARDVDFFGTWVELTV